VFSTSWKVKRDLADYNIRCNNTKSLIIVNFIESIDKG